MCVFVLFQIKQVAQPLRVGLHCLHYVPSTWPLRYEPLVMPHPAGTAIHGLEERGLDAQAHPQPG